MKKIFYIISFIIIAFSIYEIGSAVYISQTTGVLDVSASDRLATITVSQTNRESQNIGLGSDRAHLKPGTYQLTVSKDRMQVTQTVQINKKTTTHQSVSLAQPAEQTQELKKADSANALINLLPFVGPASEYKITYSYEFTSNLAKPIIIVTSPSQHGQQDAIAQIKTFGFNPSDLNIKYVLAPTK